LSDSIRVVKTFPRNALFVEQILAVLQHISHISHHRKVHDLLLKDRTSFDRPPSTEKGEKVAFWGAITSQTQHWHFLIL